MIINDENRTKLRQTLAQMKHELGVLQQSLESAPPKTKSTGYNYGEVEGYTIDEYILAFRLGNVTDLSMHLHEVFHLTTSKQTLGRDPSGTRSSDEL